MQEDNFAVKLREFMETRSLTQKDIAGAANISQSTVSRVLMQSPQRQGKAAAKLFTYMQQEITEGFVSQGRMKVIEAFDSIWDRSEEHATAIARIIKASDGLRPMEHLVERD